MLAEAEEAKSNFEIVCPCRGVVAEILVESGVEVPVQTISSGSTLRASECR